MKFTLIAAAFLTILSTASLAQNTTHTDPTTMTRAQAKILARNARTSAEYLTLRDYYAHVAQTESLKAAEEKQEWERRAANPMVYARKYPSPVDSAHYLYDSYAENARVAAAEAKHYDELVISTK